MTNPAHQTFSLLSFSRGASFGPLVKGGPSVTVARQAVRSGADVISAVASRSTISTYSTVAKRTACPLAIPASSVATSRRTVSTTFARQRATQPTAPIPEHPPSTAPRGLTARYAPRLHTLSLRTGVPLSTLAAAFLVLHELTAILPLGVVYWILQALGAGAGLVLWLEGLASEGSVGSGSVKGIQGQGSEEARADKGQKLVGIVADKLRVWMKEGGERVEKVGKRYGILGFEKVEQSSTTPVSATHDMDSKPAGIGLGSVPGTGSGAERTVLEAIPAAQRSQATDKVASAITAYIMVKALLPIRIGASLALAPAFARLFVLPYRRAVGRFKARRSPIRGDGGPKARHDS